jgi:hypothetical protein
MTIDAAFPTPPPSLLHNMSTRPRTPVTIQIDPIDSRLASFSLDGMAPELSRLVHRRTRATQLPTLSTFVCSGDVAGLVEMLNAAWARLAFRGAVLLYAGVAPSRYVRAARCRDPLLVLNVLARARGNVLLPDAPLVLRPRALDRRVVTDDPRLTSHVRLDRGEGND